MIWLLMLMVTDTVVITRLWADDCGAGTLIGLALLLAVNVAGGIKVEALVRSKYE